MSERHFPHIDERWAIFLDRDGVLNRHRPDDYVKNWSEWDWLPGSLEAIALFGRRFGFVLVVTNQQGVGRGLMDWRDLKDVHAHMLADIARAGGRVDAVYVAPELKSDPSNRRKPKPSMALEAMADYPRINPGRSIMVGDSDSDMGFGRQAGFTTVRIHQNPEEALKNPDVDFAFSSLAEVAAQIAAD